jgi:hypothetical protein
MDGYRTMTENAGSRFSCQDVSPPKGFEMKNRPKPKVRPVDYHLDKRSPRDGWIRWVLFFLWVVNLGIGASNIEGSERKKVQRLIVFEFGQAEPGDVDGPG